MMSNFYLILLITLFAVSTQTLEIVWSGNVTSDEVSSLDYYSMRSSVLFNWIGFSSYFSAFVEVERDDDSASVEADAILGVVTYAQLPASTFAYYDGSANLDWANFASSGSAQLDTEQTAGILLSAFVRLEERTPSGDVVATHRFKNYRWDVNFEGTGSSDGLHYLTVKAATGGIFVSNPAPADIYVSWVIADTYGLFTVDDVETFIWPKNLESFFKVENYDYADSENNLVLIMGSCSGSVSRTSETKASWDVDLDVVTSGDELRITYSTVAEIDGETGTVNIEREFGVEASDILDGQLSSFTTQLNAAWEGGAECHRTDIAFAAGANVIKYDPGLSHGPLPNSGLAVVLSSVLLIVALF